MLGQLGFPVEHVSGSVLLLSSLVADVPTFGRVALWAGATANANRRDAVAVIVSILTRPFGRVLPPDTTYQVRVYTVFLVALFFQDVENDNHRQGDNIDDESENAD